ncbi:YigZ family protein [Flavobacteriaceae bacterium]|nr:YigZ family protein [Flavobacteriaceae bacterium]
MTEAYRLRPSASHYRVSDDGEPNNSAGMPILGQLQAKDLTNTLVVVVRYFGGIKLGVGGLIMAYKTAAKQILETIQIVTFYKRDNVKINFTYNELSYVMRII